MLLRNRRNLIFLLTLLIKGGGIVLGRNLVEFQDAVLLFCIFRLLIAPEAGCHDLTMWGETCK